MHTGNQFDYYMYGRRVVRLASSLRHLLNHPQLKRTSLHALVRLGAMHVTSTKPAAGDAPQLAGGSAVSTASERASDSDAAQTQNHIHAQTQNQDPRPAPDPLPEVCHQKACTTGT